jgi:uncharacterized protein
MSLSIHEAAVSLTLRTLRALSGVLEKGRLHAEAEKWDQSALLGMRLYPDMFTLTRQVQVVSDQCKGLVARLASLDPPKFADTEATFAELKQRLDRTIDFIQGVDAKKFEGADQRAIELKFPNNTLNFSSGWEYFLAFAVPNIYFHSAMAYGILRNSGVKVGKPDFIGRIS